MSESQKPLKVCETCKRLFLTEEDFLKDTQQWKICSSENLWFNCGCGSTLMIPKGKFDWYSPTLFMSDEAKSVFNRIAKVKDLPHIPNAVMQIQQLLQNSDSETTALANAVKGDPFLAAEILRVAENMRSLRQSHEQPLKSLEHAITYIGRKSLGDLVLAASIKAFKLESTQFNEKGFWAHSFLMAAISEILTVELKINYEKDKMYLAGCLANIGKVISAICFPQKVSLVENHVTDLSTMTTWERAEKAHSLVSHCIMGEIGGAMWGLPKFAIEAARYHHTKFEKKKALGRGILPTLVGFANILAHWVNLEPGRIDDEMLEHYKDVFNLTDDTLDRIVSAKIMPMKDKLVY